jgi:hypothetical protein
MNRLCLSLCAAISLFPLAARAVEPPGYSGMARIAENTFLTVNDRKTPRDAGERLGVLTIEPTGARFQPVMVADWGSPQGPPSDLEAAAAIPGRPGECLLAESGRFMGRFGRIFHVRLEKVGEGWRAHPLGVFAPEPRALTPEGSVYQANEVEGIACFQAGDRLILVLGERGGQARDGRAVARLVWGELDLAAYRFTRMGDRELVGRSVLGDRDLSDLLVREEGGRWVVWSVATVDAGDNGPFRSLVFRAGEFRLDRRRGRVDYVRGRHRERALEADGVKIEALAEPAQIVAGSLFSIGTDDENYGGVWRPLGLNSPPGPAISPTGPAKP